MSTARRWSVLASTALLLLVLAVGVVPASAVDVAPTVVAGNPSCVALGYDFGFKPQPEPPPSGTYTFPDGIYETTISSGGVYFDWTSTLGIDAVIVKGGPNANVYAYDPESFSDSGLHSPINPNNNNPFAISHIEFCYDYEVDVSKDARTSFTRTYEWDITKSVVPAEMWMFAGASGTAGYTVAVDKTGFTDSDWAVSGTISVANNTPFDAVIESVSDVVSSGIQVPVDCGVSFPHTLAAGQALSCSYSSSLPDGSSRVNTATVATSGIVGGGEATADVVFGDPTTEVNANITVDDTNLENENWKTGDDTSWTYSSDFACSSDPKDYINGHYMYNKDNTATIVETGQSDDASVTVHCYAPVVSKDATTSFTRTYDWTIDKVGDQSNLTLSLGQQFLVNYDVTVNASATDSDWAVAGSITVANPNPKAAMTVSLADVVSPDVVANLDCGGSLVVPAGSSATCGYSADLPDGTNRTNTATATLNNIDFTGSADVVFGDPTLVVDECIDVTDDQFGSLGTVCADQAPKVFSYSLTVGPYQACGMYEFNNVASFTTNDTGTTDQDSWMVSVNVPCADGCTLTPGYWKTHSQEGPAPYDDNWLNLGLAQEDTVFFLSGMSYYDVLWTSPQGNAYYILAHAYIAAELNQLNGADFSDAQAAFDAATVLFETYTPAQVATMKGKSGNVVRAQFINLATILDNYNNGLIGPGHCSE